MVNPSPSLSGQVPCDAVPPGMSQRQERRLDVQQPQLLG